MSNAINKQQTQEFRRIGHKLKPVVTIASKGLTGNILDDIDDRLEKNELLKVKLVIADRDLRKATVKRICDTLDAIAVQEIGSIALLYRPADEPDPKLSNLLRV